MPERASDPPFITYDRAVLVDVLVYHWATSTSGCGCGWAVLGASHPEHVADVYEASVVTRAE
jgi:hypothetical protein